MIKSFYVFENTLYSHLTNLRDNDEEEEISKLIGFDPTNYDLTVYRHDMKFQLSFKEKFITNELNLYDEVFTRALFVGTYGWDHYVDDSEIEYINRYFSHENIESFRTLIKILDANINLDDREEIGYVFLALDGLFDISDIINEISDAQSDAIIKHVNDMFEKLPITITKAYSSEFDIDFEFDVQKIGEYIDTHKLQDVNTVADFLNAIDFDEFDDEFENVYEYLDEIDYTKIQTEIQTQLDRLIDLFGDYDIFVKPDDPNQFKLFDEDIEKNPKYKLPYDIFSKLDFNNIDYAKNIGGRILAWFKSYTFQKDYMKDPSLEKYEKLIENDILNPKIEDEYEYLKGIEDFNL